MVNMIKNVCFFVSTIIITILLCGCNSDNNPEVWHSPRWYYAEDIDTFLNEWYLIQKGNAEISPNNVDDATKIDNLSNLPSIVIPIANKENIVLESIGVFQNPKNDSVVFHYEFVDAIKKDFNNESGIHVCVTTDSIKNMLDEEDLEKCFITEDKDRIFNSKEKIWYFVIENGTIYMSFPSDVDATDPDIIYEYFDFNQINIIEYESQMK